LTPGGGVHGGPVKVWLEPDECVVRETGDCVRVDGPHLDHCHQRQRRVSSLRVTSRPPLHAVPTREGEEEAARRQHPSYGRYIDTTTPVDDGFEVEQLASFERVTHMSHPQLAGSLVMLARRLLQVEEELHERAAPRFERLAEEGGYIPADVARELGHRHLGVLRDHAADEGSLP
jgi:hypothetical protein